MTTNNCIIIFRGRGGSFRTSRDNFARSLHLLQPRGIKIDRLSLSSFAKSRNETFTFPFRARNITINRMKWNGIDEEAFLLAPHLFQESNELGTNSKKFSRHFTSSKLIISSLEIYNSRNKICNQNLSNISI